MRILARPRDGAPVALALGFVLLVAGPSRASSLASNQSDATARKAIASAAKKPAAASGLHPAAVHAAAQAQTVQAEKSSGFTGFLNDVKDFFQKQFSSLPWMPSFSSHSKTTATKAATTPRRAVAPPVTPSTTITAAQVVGTADLQALTPVSQAQILAETVATPPAPVPAPEPSTLLILGAALAGWAIRAARRRRGTIPAAL